MYEDLKQQFFNLSEKERNALIVYKSKIGLLINDIDNNPDYEGFYRYYLKLFSNPLNIVTKMSTFKDLDLTSLESFIASVKSIKTILDNAINKLVINEDLTVYRAISSSEKINGISKSNIISTSMSFADSFRFANNGENINIYQINLKKGSHVCIIPYSVLIDKSKLRLVVSISDTQNEIIINKDNYDFDKVEQKDLNSVSIIELNAYDISLNKKVK